MQMSAYIDKYVEQHQHDAIIFGLHNIHTRGLNDQEHFNV
jgi:hypothetical protein